jgi:hypothetical protein
MSAASRANLVRGQEIRAANRLAGQDARAAGQRSRWELYKAGELKISEATDDEISRGQFAGLGGGFEGRPPSMNGRQHNEFKAELLKRGQRRLNGMYQMALGVVEEIAKSGVSEDRDRLKASTIIMERVAGKVPDRVEIGPVDSFAEALEGIINESVKDAPGISER